MKLLFVGDLTSTSRLHAFTEAFQDLGHRVVPVESQTALEPSGKSRRLSFLYRVLWKMGFELDEARLNDRVLNAALRERPDQVWIYKPTAIRPSLLRKLKACLPFTTLVSLSEDDMNAWHNQTWHYRWGLKYYDFSVSTKSYNVGELTRLGAHNVIFIDNSFDHRRRKQINVTDEEKVRLGGQVGFIGTFEPDRARSMLYLARNGICVRIWGSEWEHLSGRHPNLVVESKPMPYEPDGLGYATGICAFDINLCFLRKMNRDLQTGRSVDIPACGAFMIAERTDEHQRLFKEDEEAVFFESQEELLTKVRFYLDHPDERKRIAANGYRRSVGSDYSCYGRIKFVLSEIAKVSRMTGVPAESL